MKYFSNASFNAVLLVISILGSGPANAVVYNFDHQVWGRSSIALNNAAGRETFVEVTENLATPDNDVLFKFTNNIPPENTTPYGEAGVRHIYFDTGNFTDLITEVGIWEQSAGVNMVSPSSRLNMDLGNSFDTTFTEDFSAGTGARYPADRLENAIQPGEYLVLTATLGTGKNFNDVIEALSVGRNPDENIAQTGLRISEIVHRIWGDQADDDHAAFVVADIVDMSGPEISSLTANPIMLLDTQTSQLQVVANDPEPGPLALTYQWTIVNGGGVLDDTTSPTPVYTPADVVGTQSVTLQVEVTDGLNTVSGTMDLQVDDADSPPPNELPQISTLAAMPASILDTDFSNLEVVASDPDNSPALLSYQWTIVSGGGVLDDSTSPTPVYTPVDVVGTRTVTLQVVVSDGEATVNGVLTLTVEDANPPAPGAELLFEDFSSDSLTGWTVYDEGTPASDWSIISGQMAQRASTNDSSASGALTHLGTFLSYDGGVSWTDYRLKFTMRTTTDDDTLGVMFRTQDTNNYYRFTWDMQRKQRRLVKRTGGVFTLLADDNVPYVRYQTYQVEIVVLGEQLEVWIDGELIFQVTDADHNYGTFAFQTWLHNAAYFDDVQVEDLSGGTFNAIPQIASVTASPASILDTDFSNLEVLASDPDNSPALLSYQWTIVSGGGVLDDSTSPTPVYTPADVVGSTRTVALQVEVSDGEATVRGDLTLTVEDANPPAPGVELLFEDFSSDSLTGWTVYDEGTPASDWSIISGQMAQRASTNDSSASGALTHLGTFLSYDGGVSWTDYRLKFTMRTTTDDDTLGIMFRTQDTNNYYRFTWDMQRKQRLLVKRTGGGFTLLAEDNVPYVRYQTYQIEIVALGDQLEVWIDGVRIFQVTDADHNYGTFAFQTWLHNAAYFDDVQVEDLSGGTFNAIPQITSVTATPASILDTDFSNLEVVAFDPDDSPALLSYQWTIVSGDGVLDDSTSPTPVYTPADVVGTQTVTLQVTVSDGEVTVRGDLTLTVEDANPPPLGLELLFEDFNSGSLTGWTVYDEGTPASDWSIISGQMAQRASTNDSSASGALSHLGTFLSYDGGMSWTDYRLKFTMRTTTDDDTLGIMFRTQDTNNYYRFTWDMQRKQRRLVKRTGGVFTLLAEDNVPYVRYQTYQVEIVVLGEQLEVWIDGVRIFQVTDADHNSGTFAFQTWLHNAAYFDDVQVNAME